MGRTSTNVERAHVSTHMKLQSIRTTYHGVGLYGIENRWSNDWLVRKRAKNAPWPPLQVISVLWYVLAAILLVTELKNTFKTDSEYTVTYYGVSIMMGRAPKARSTLATKARKATLIKKLAMMSDSDVPAWVNWRKRGIRQQWQLPSLGNGSGRICRFDGDGRFSGRFNKLKIAHRPTLKLLNHDSLVHDSTQFQILPLYFLYLSTNFWTMFFSARTHLRQELLCLPRSCEARCLAVWQW